MTSTRIFEVGANGALGVVTVALTAVELVVGRSTRCAVTVPDPRVSAEHLRITSCGNGTWRVTDLGSHNGSYVRGHRIESIGVDRETLVQLGNPVTGPAVRLVPPPRARAPRATPHPRAARSGRTAVGRQGGVAVTGVTVRRGSSELLHDVSASFPAATVTAVIGPSGAGKSTLVAAITGRARVHRGREHVAGRDIVDAGVTATVGLVPQQDVLHTSLTVRASLRCAARLRLPAASTRRERLEAVDDVLGRLGLLEHAHVRIDRLSGGQRKRVNVAVELLNRPTVLILDEPTAGLDPHLERAVMSDLAALAAEGCTVIVVTHSVASLEFAGHVVAIADGRVLCEGTPEQLRRFFRARGMTTVFAEMAGPAAAAWADSWLRTARPVPPPAGPPATVQPTKGARPTGGWYQLPALVLRNARLLVANRPALGLLLIQAPVLGLLSRLFPNSGGFTSTATPNPDVRTVLLVLVLAATWLGTFAAIRVVVDERLVLERELAAGLRPRPYLAARSFVLAALIAVQVATLSAAALYGRDLPNGRIVHAPGLELGLVLLCAGWAAGAVGLLVSAVARTGAGAAAVAPLIVVPQLLLCGALTAVDRSATLDVATRLVSARSAFSAAASSADLAALELAPHAPAAWDPTPTALCVNVGQLIALTVTAWLLTCRCLPAPRAART